MINIINRHPCYQAGPPPFFLQISVNLGASCSNIGVFTKENMALLSSWCGYQDNIIIRGQREFVAHHNSNIGTRRAQLRNISHGGFCLQSGILSINPAITPQQSLGASHPRGQRESCCYAQLKHRHPLSTAHKVTWGLFVSNTKEFERTLVTGYRPTTWKPGVFT